MGRKRTKVVGARLTTDEYEQLQSLAEARGARSTSSYVTDLIVAAINAEKIKTTFFRTTMTVPWPVKYI